MDKTSGTGGFPYRIIFRRTHQRGAPAVHRSTGLELLVSEEGPILPVQGDIPSLDLLKQWSVNKPSVVTTVLSRMFDRVVF